MKEIVHDGENRLVKVFRVELSTTEKRLEKFVQEVVHEVVHHEIENLAHITAQGFKSMDERFEQVDRRFEQVDRRFEQVDRRFERIDGSLAHLGAKLDTARHDIAVIKENFVYRDESRRVEARS